MKNSDGAFLIAGIWVLVFEIAKYTHAGFIDIFAIVMFGGWLFAGINRLARDDE